VNNGTPSDPLTPLVLELLITLHSHKTVGYGDAWRKRGELLSIFTNLARKYDRLVVALDKDMGSHDERLPDTAGDLCLYAAKYLTWLAEQHPEAFDTVSRNVTSTECADDGATEALAHTLRALDIEGRGDVSTSWSRLKAAFCPLDAALIAQGEHRDAEIPMSWAQKVELAWAITASAAELLVALAGEDAEAWTAWREEIEALDDCFH
jgi:hypothetical protein